MIGLLVVFVMGVVNEWPEVGDEPPTTAKMAIVGGAEAWPFGGALGYIYSRLIWFVG